MIRILFTIPNFDTAGSGKALLNIAQGLDRNKFEVHIACLHSRGDFFKVVEQSGIPIHVFNFVSPARPIMQLLKNCWLVAKEFKKIKPDLIHSFHYSADYSEAIAARMAHIPWVFTKKNMSWGGASADAWKLRSWLAQAIIVQNTDMIQQFYPKQQNITLIPRGVNCMYFTARKEDTIIRQQMKTAATDRVIICVANFVPVKGIEVLMVAFEKLEAAFPDWKLWLIGDDSNDYGNTLKSWVNNHRLESKIIFAGKKLDVRPFLNAAEIFVLPTLEVGEGSPVAMLEAMVNGKIVFGSKVSGIKDQLVKFPNHLFKSGDSNELVDKLKPLMNADSVTNQILGEKFATLANETASIEKEIATHQNFYEKTLG